MADSKKYNGSTWEHSLRKLTTSTDTLTSLPTKVIADGNNATVGLAGNMSQTGTPTPTTPIQPQETGERTVNLYDKSAYPALQGYSDNDGMWRENTPSFCSIVMPCEPNTTYVVSKMVTNRQRLSTYSSYPQNGDIALQVEKDGDTGSFSDITTHADAHWLAILLWYDNGDIGWRNRTAEIVDTVQVETGVSKPTAYEPYGYKIPINLRGINLFDYTVSESGTISSTGVLEPNAKCWRSTIYYEIDETKTYRASKAKDTIRICYYDSSKTFISREQISSEEKSKIITIPSGAKYIKWTLYAPTGLPDLATVEAMKIMLSEGSEIISYEPYVQPTLSNIYFGNVQTTRYIKKLIFDGTENWEIRAEETNNALFMLKTGSSAINHLIESSHFSQIRVGTTTTDIGVDVTPEGHVRFRPINVSSMSVDDFKSFLAQQYANGTPVTVWYVLTEPTTGIVNEPIRKIGDYADTVSGITIPTIAGTNSFDVLTTLKPSEVSLAYTGWHDASVKEWDGSEWQ